MNKKMTPWELKPVVDKHKLDGAVLITVKGDQFGVVSFGKDEIQCMRFRIVNETIEAMVMNGGLDLEPPF